VPDMGESDTLEREKTRLDTLLADLLKDLNLIPSRFRICRRCGNIFYQPTGRAKHYCSERCAGAVRQARFVEKQRRLSDEGIFRATQANVHT